MKINTTTGLAAGVVCAMGVAALAANAQSARLRPVVEAAPVAVVAAPVETDAQRRARLNARLQQMLQDGKGGRLADPVARPAPTRAARADPRPVRATAPRAVAAPVVERVETPGTIAPPIANPYATPSRSRGGRYVAPRLDLTSAPRIPDNDIECLTQAIYYEARNESETGQAAVAEVVMNRSRHGAYPKSVCAVVYQRNSRTCQFTFTCDGSIGRGRVNMNAWARAERIARAVHDGASPANLPRSSVNYHANYVKPSWGRRLERVRQIGAHIFYGAPLNGGSTPGAGTAAEPAPTRGLMFVRNEALDRAYALVAGGTAAGAETAAAPTAAGV